MRRRGIGRVGRPSLVGTVARTAVVAGTATVVAGSVSKHQAGKQQAAAAAAAPSAEDVAYQQQQAADAAAYQAQQAAAQQQAMVDQAAEQAAAQIAAQQAAAAPAAAAEEDPIEQLKKLGELKAQGILTEEEFAAEKAKILG